MQDVTKVDKSQRVRVGFVRGCEFCGEVEGAEVGLYLVGNFVIPSGFASLLAAPPVIIGTSSLGGYLFKTDAEKVYDSVDGYITNCRR